MSPALYGRRSSKVTPPRSESGGGIREYTCRCTRGRVERFALQPLNSGFGIRESRFAINISAYSAHRSYRPDQSRRKGMTTSFTHCATALVMAALASATALADPIPPGGQSDRLKVI